MDHHQLKIALTRAELLDEIHHLLWVEPLDSNGTKDDGWNCRDHAVVTAALAQLMGFTTWVVCGQAKLVQGPEGKLPAVSVGIKIHAWALVEQSGTYDLSLRLSRADFSPGWRPCAVTAIAQDSCQPSAGTKFSCVSEEREYEDIVAQAILENGHFHAVFWGTPRISSRESSLPTRSTSAIRHSPRGYRLSLVRKNTCMLKPFCTCGSS